VAPLAVADMAADPAISDALEVSVAPAATAAPVALPPTKDVDAVSVTPGAVAPGPSASLAMTPIASQSVSIARHSVVGGEKRGERQFRFGKITVN
jgi:hypothetical protein